MFAPVVIAAVPVMVLAVMVMIAMVVPVRAPIVVVVMTLGVVPMSVTAVVAICRLRSTRERQEGDETKGDGDCILHVGILDWSRQ